MRILCPAFFFLCVIACGQNPSTLSSENPSVLLEHPIGKLCTATDPNFDGYRYSEHIAHCQRNVPRELKDAVAKRYAVKSSDFHLYQFDHYIPLNSGGADDIDNIWPQPLEQAHQKDDFELKIFEELSAGTLTQAGAIAKIKAWKPI